MIVATIIITILYILLISGLIIGFNRIKPFTHDETEPLTTFSIIIPYKNESENLPDLLKTLENLNYPINKSFHLCAVHP